jgi:hypothetical protein
MAVTTSAIEHKEWVRPPANIAFITWARDQFATLTLLKEMVTFTIFWFGVVFSKESSIIRLQMKSAILKLEKRDGRFPVYTKAKLYEKFEKAAMDLMLWSLLEKWNIMNDHGEIPLRD